MIACGFWQAVPKNVPPGADLRGFCSSTSCGGWTRWTVPASFQGWSRTHHASKKWQNMQGLLGKEGSYRVADIGQPFLFEQTGLESRFSVWSIWHILLVGPEIASLWNRRVRSSFLVFWYLYHPRNIYYPIWSWYLYTSHNYIIPIMYICIKSN